MGRPRKIMAAVKSVSGGLMTMEKPKALKVIVPSRLVEPEPACTHCGCKGTSKSNKIDDRYFNSLGFVIVYMRCHSESCLKSTNGIGRGWKYHRRQK